MSLSLLGNDPASGVNVAQTALSDDFVSANPKILTKYMRPSGIGTDKLSSSQSTTSNSSQPETSQYDQNKNFNILGVIMAALTFIIILSWFELLRLVIQSFFIKSHIVIEQMIAYLIYTIVGSLFASLLLFIFYKIMKSI